MSGWSPYCRSPAAAGLQPQAVTHLVLGISSRIFNHTAVLVPLYFSATGLQPQGSEAPGALASAVER
jgi:hypothetical protein